MSKKVMMVLAHGFEETEAIVPIDILRRAEVEVITAGLSGDMINGAHDVMVKTDVVFSGYDPSIDAVIFPGGMPGAENLASSPDVKGMVLKMNSEDKIVAAICASPALVLAPTGILSGKKATCFPGMEKVFAPGVNFVAEEVVRDGNVITSRGAGTAAAFGLKIAEVLVGKPKADMVGEQMLYL